MAWVYRGGMKIWQLFFCRQITAEDSEKEEILEMSLEGWQLGQVAGDLGEEELLGKNSSDMKAGSSLAFLCARTSGVPGSIRRKDWETTC